MKYFLIFLFVITISAFTRNLLESKPAKTAGPTTLDQLPLPLGNGKKLLDEANTAPTPIPEDTSLIHTPEGSSVLQAQEEQPRLDTPILDPEAGTEKDSQTKKKAPIEALPGNVP
jgi:hypothetical protein